MAYYVLRRKQFNLKLFKAMFPNVLMTQSDHEKTKLYDPANNMLYKRMFHILAQLCLCLFWK